MFKKLKEYGQAYAGALKTAYIIGPPPRRR